MTDRQLLEKLYSEVTKIKKILKVEEQTSKWVRIGTLMRELNLTRNQVRYIRVQNPTIARQKASKQYEYDLTAFQKLAA